MIRWLAYCNGCGRISLTEPVIVPCDQPGHYRTANLCRECASARYAATKAERDRLEREAQTTLEVGEEV